MTAYIDELKDRIRSEMEELTPEGRLFLIAEIMIGYCEYCGDATHGRVCHCQNDE